VVDGQGRRVASPAVRVLSSCDNRRLPQARWRRMDKTLQRNLGLSYEIRARCGVM
jgi:hypothetical protein